MTILQPLLEGEEDLDPPTEKTEEQKTAFTRIVTSIHDFAIFLRHLYIPDEAILIPPEGGWPEITKESWSSFGKTDEVIEVLRHLTYIKSRCTGDRYEFLPESGLCDFRCPYTVKEAHSGNGRGVTFMTELPYEPAPAYVVGLSGGSRYSEIPYLDCRNGVVYGEGTGDGGWGEGKRRPVEEYFAMLKDKFRQMQLLSNSDYEVCKDYSNMEGVMKPFKEIYTRYGWPDDYQRDACVAEVTESGKPGNILRLMGCK